MSEIDLSWGASSDPDSPSITYHIERCSGVGCSGFVEIATTSSIIFADTGLVSGTSYSYRVRASDPSNNFSGYSNTVTAVTLGGGPPPVVIVSYNFENGIIPNSGTLMPNLVPTTILVEGNGNHFLRETASPSDCGPSFNTTCPKTRAELFIGHDSLDLNNVTVQYNFRMRIPSTNPTSGHASVLWQLFQAAGFNRTIWMGSGDGSTGGPQTPDQLFLYNQAGTPFPSGPFVKQSFSFGPIDYDVWHSYSFNVFLTTSNSQGRIDIKRDGVFVGSLIGMATSFDGTVPTDNYINAVDLNGLTLIVDYDDVQIISNPAPFTAPDTTPPTNPSGLTTQIISANEIDLSWTISTDPDSPSIIYHIERCSGVGCSGFAEIATTSSALYSNTGLTSGTSYSYRVRASDLSSNFSGYSNIATAATPFIDTTPPTAVVLSGNSVGSTSVSLSWTPSTDPDDTSATLFYHIGRCQGGNCGNFNEFTATQNLFYNDANLQPNTIYRYFIRVTDSVGNSSPNSNIITVTTGVAGPQRIIIPVVYVV